MSSNTNIGNTPVNQGYVQLVHMGETGGIDGTLRTLYDGDGTASDLQIASNKVKISTQLYIGSKTITEYVQDIVGDMFTTGSYTNITTTYDDTNGNIDLSASGEVTLTGSQTLTNKTLTSPVINTGVSGSAILDSDTMSGVSATTLSSSESIKAYVDTEVAGLVDSAPDNLNTLNELAAALDDNADILDTLLVKSANLSDLTNAGTARSNLGLGSVATLSSIAVSNITASAIQLSSESFADNDTTIMTSAAINDRIESFGYTTTTGTVTNVSVGSGLDVSNSTTTPSITLDFTELADMTEGVVAADELILLDDSTLKRKAISEITLSTFDDTGFSSGISFNGSTANGLLTYGNSTTADVESNLTFDGSTLALTGTLTSTGHLKIADGQAYMAGGGEDVQLFHSNLYGGFLFNQTNDFYFDQVAADKDWIFRVDDSDGGGDYQEVMRIQGSTQRVGIGTTSPSYKLDVYGTTRIYSASGDADLRIEGGASNTTSFLLRNGAGNNRVDFLTGGANAMTINSSQRVGIGTTSPGTKLEVKANGDTSQEVIKIRNSSGTEVMTIAAIDSNGDGYINFNSSPGTINTNGGDLVLSPGGSGNVGIGVASPEGKVHIYNGNANVAPDSDGDELVVENSNRSGISILSGTGSGSIGSIIFGSSDDGNGAGVTWQNYINTLTVKTQNTAGILRFASNNNVEAMRILADGKVGIGTQSPAQKLHVVGGQARFDDHISIQPTKQLYLDGGLDTYIKESSPNVMEFYCGNSRRMQLTTTYLQVPDNALLGAGNDVDVFIKHDGNGHFQSNAGQMYINNVATTNIIMSVGNDEKVRIENDGDLHVKADVVAYSSTPSDIRLKKNFTKIENGLDVIRKLDGQTFNWKKDEGRLSAGFKAQEVEKVLPHLVDERELPLHSDDEKDYKVLRYEEIIPYLVEAIKEQQQQINQLEEKLNG